MNEERDPNHSHYMYIQPRSGLVLPRSLTRRCRVILALPRALTEFEVPDI